MRVFLLAWFVALAAAQRVSEMSFSPPYINHEYHNQYYEIGGTGLITRSGAELTGDYPGQQGWMVSKYATLPDNFELIVKFRLSGESKGLYGDGVALRFLEDDTPLEQGPVFGVQDKLKGTMIAIDTYRNGRPGKAFPYIVLSQNDGNQPYDVDHDGKANEIRGYSARKLYNPSQEWSWLSIRYQKGGNLLVKINYRKDWEEVFNLPFNLNNARRFSISGSTGQLSEKAFVSAIEVTRIDPISTAVGSASAASQPIRKDPDHKPSGGSWIGWFFKSIFKLALIAALCFGAKKGFDFYKQSRKPKKGYLD